MQWRNIAGIEVSALCLGCWEIGGGTAWGDVGEAEAVRLLHAARDMGVNFLDTAPVYGTGVSETLIGRAIQGRRAAYVISTKCGLNWRQAEGRLEYDRDGVRVFRNLAAEAIRRDLEGSLRRLKTDYVDFFITHRQQDEVLIEETMGELLKLKQEGKIRGIGISNSVPSHLAKYQKIGTVDLVQEPYNILDREFEPYLERCEQTQVTAHCYNTLCRGLLTGKITADANTRGTAQSNVKWFRPELRPAVLAMITGWSGIAAKYDCSLANLALAWVLSRGKAVLPLIGASRAESLMDSLKAPALSISAEDLHKMQQDAEAVRGMR